MDTINSTNEIWCGIRHLHKYIKAKNINICVNHYLYRELIFFFHSVVIYNNQKGYSAGVETHGVNPKAIQIMKEDNIDISKHTSNNVNEYRDIDFDYVITVCDNVKEQCPYFPSKAKKFHYNFPDPAKAT